MNLVLLALVQIQLGSIDGRVLDPSGAAVRGAKAFVDDGSRERTVESDESGRFRFGSLPYGLYRLRVAAAGFETHEEVVEIRSNLTSEISIALALSGTRESLTVRAADRTEVSAITRIGDAEAERLPGASIGGSVQPLVAAAPGWSTEDNGLIHNRGVDDGFLYVVGGIPWFDRIDTFFAAATDVEAFQSLEILDGHLPAEYGNASGGVINVVPRSGLSRDWAANAAVALGSLESWGGSAATGGRISSRAGLFVAASYRGSEERFLDPVDPDNLNNAGNVLRFTSRLDFRSSPNDLLVFDLTAGRSGFRVTNTLEQELAGQRQRQDLRARRSDGATGRFARRLRSDAREAENRARCRRREAVLPGPARGARGAARGAEPRRRLLRLQFFEPVQRNPFRPPASLLPAREARVSRVR